MFLPKTYLLESLAFKLQYIFQLIYFKQDNHQQRELGVDIS